MAPRGTQESRTRPAIHANIHIVKGYFWNQPKCNRQVVGSTPTLVLLLTGLFPWMGIVARLLTHNLRVVALIGVFLWLLAFFILRYAFVPGPTCPVSRQIGTYPIRCQNESRFLCQIRLAECNRWPSTVFGSTTVVSSVLNGIHVVAGRLNWLGDCYSPFVQQECASLKRRVKVAVLFSVSALMASAQVGPGSCRPRLLTACRLSHDNTCTKEEQ